MNEIAIKAYDLRKHVLRMIKASGCGHIGGDMSVMEIMVTLFFRHLNFTPHNVKSPQRDRFVLSKGHCVESYYAVLAELGFFDIETIIAEFSHFGSPYQGHPNNKLQGIEMNTGSLGHGLPLCVGMALAGKLDDKQYRVYTVMGDGELAEGSIWEAAMAAGHYKLDNLCAVVDKNGLQISGATENVMAQEPLAARWNSFGWNVIECMEGNSVEALDKAFNHAKKFTGKPSVIIAHTVKGCGSPVMENNAAWHHKVPNDDEYIQMMADFEERKEALIRE